MKVSVRCGGCKTVLSGDDTRAKIRQHDRRCGMKLYRRGVDMEVFVNKQRRMVDFTIVHANTASHRDTPIDTIIRTKKAEKFERYVKSGMVPENEFVVAPAFSSGALHDDLLRLLGEVSRECETDFNSLFASTRNYQ